MLKKVTYPVSKEFVKRKCVFSLSRTFAECPRQTIWSNFQPTKSQRKHVSMPPKKQPKSFGYIADQQEERKRKTTHNKREKKLFT